MARVIERKVAGNLGRCINTKEEGESGWNEAGDKERTKKRLKRVHAATRKRRLENVCHWQSSLFTSSLLL